MPLAAVLALGAGVGATASAQGQPARHALLDVPHVTQTPELCGGAAVAMVMRYWGERQIFAEDFAALVVPSERGIPTGALAAAVRDRTWRAVVLPAVADTGRIRIRTEVDQGRPLIALIEVSPRTYHFIVIVGATTDQVVLHDPARAPFRVMPWAEFDRAWSAANRWVMLVRPPEGGRSTPPAAAVPTDASGTAPPMTPCAALIQRGVELARTGDPAGGGAGAGGRHSDVSLQSGCRAEAASVAHGRGVSTCAPQTGRVTGGLAGAPAVRTV